MVVGIRSYVVLVFMALASGWLSWLFSLERDRSVLRVNNVIDYYANNFVITVSDDEGFQKHRLKAASMTHFIDKDVTELDLPVVTIFDPEKPPWIIRSDRGTVSSDGTRILFAGDVFIDREGMENVRPVKIVTKNLLVEPEKQYAETDERAELITPSNKVSGTGIRFFFSNPIHVTLLSDVRGKHEVR